MNTFPKLLISSCALGLALAAHAGMATSASDAYPITNGGTGFIGVTASAGMPRTMVKQEWMAAAQTVSRMPTAAGEASTMVNGRPNQDPDLPAHDSMGMRHDAMQSMGNASAMVARNPAWGTPD